MTQMNHHYEPEFKEKLVRLHLEDGRSLKSLATEYGVAHGSISIWVKKFRKECQSNQEAWHKINQISCYVIIIAKNSSVKIK